MKGPRSFIPCPKCGFVNRPAELELHGQSCVICGYSFEKPGLKQPQTTPEETASRKLLKFCQDHNINLESQNHT